MKYSGFVYSMTLHHYRNSTMSIKKNHLLNPLTVCVFSAIAASAHAQVVDDVDLRQEGGNAVVVVKFVTPVQYSNSVSARASDLVQVFYTVLPTRESVNLQRSERRLPGGGSIPEITVRDESAASTTPNSINRKLLVSFGLPLKFTVRPGKDVRSIEIVLVGLGESVQAVLAKKSKVLPLKPGASVTVTPTAPTTQAAAETDASAAALLVKAQSAFDGGNYNGAIESLNQLLNLPPNGSSRKAQEMIGLARLNAGDKVRAATEFELFIKLYPAGEDSDRIRQLLASLPTIGPVTASQTKAVVEATSTVNGSLSTYYYGGKSDTRSQDFLDSSLAGLPVLQSDNTLSSTDQKQMQTGFDMNWRYRDDAKDMRFVVRDSLTHDYLKGNNRERLSALYVDYRSLALGSNIRVGRQSPNGGGVMYRFDGIQAGYKFAPKWRINGVLGKPSDDLLDTRRTFYGMSIDAEALTKSLSGSVYAIEQVIDGVTDRRGVGTEVRYFKGGLSANGQFDYDPMLRKVNIAAFQSYWQYSDDIALNAMLDRRTTPFLSLGNVLFFQDPNLATPAKRISELLGTTPIETLRDEVKALTAYQNQFRVGGTKVLTPKWQVGADFSLTSVDAIKPVALLLPDGQAATGNLWGVSTQLIGTNLYSARDTHVFNVSFLGGPLYHGTLLTYNNLTSLDDKWQIEPSLKYYTQSGNTATAGITGSNSNTLWGTGLRVTYRLRSRWSLESELTYERSDIASTTMSTTSATANKQTSTRISYYLGARADF
ncbi:hypothetical protein [Rhodoferax sp.]|uniref:hypothetical protein n=1 Tax=Rhodoferax sp. TaxID=50421 RepID=UPI00283CCC27|nr:hypothetical protein [Rhodoferax sp.]MDR3371656.1 hypothetical protein [Rhodoferax sp.]